jgi:dihydroorotate dehydrogenase electron transfer subunit
MSVFPITENPDRPPPPRLHDVACQVKSNQPVNRDYRQLVLDAPAEILTCAPGQFFHLLCPVSLAQQPYLRRPMSIYGYYPEKGELHFLYKVTGAGTAAMAGLEPGDNFTVLGPLGRGFDILEGWQKLLLVARGVGLATLAPLALQARQMGRQLTAICSARSPDLLMSLDYLQALGARVIAVTDEQGTSDTASVRALIEGLIADEGVDALYTCGSNRLLALLQDIGKAHNIPGQIALEQQMACGLGMCQCCVRGFRRSGQIVHERVCREGPVFDIQEAIGC